MGRIGFADQLRRLLTQLYLTRFPLLLAVVLVGFAPFALFGVPAMFRSMLVLSETGIRVVSLFTIAAAFTVLATRRAVLLHGPARFDVDWGPRREDLGVAHVGIHLTLAMPLTIAAIILSVREGSVGWGGAVWGAVSGAILAGLFMFAVAVVHALLTDRNQALPDLVTPADTPLIARAHEQRVLMPRHGRARRFLGRLLLLVKPYAGPGYFNAQGEIEPAHVFAAGLFVTYALLYGAGYFLFRPGTTLGAAVPALVHFLTAITLATWLFSGLAFFLDRHRLPTLLTVAVISLLVWVVSKSDYYFDLEPRPARVSFAVDSPQTIADARRHPLLTVVAVDGGGIQAAGWAATVLTRLNENWPDFNKSTRFISAISGGAVGTMYYVDALQEGSSPDGKSLSPDALRRMGSVRQSAVRGSLSEAAWGLAYPDLVRTLVPIPSFLRFEKDRGWAMERAWGRHWDDGHGPMLREMAAGIREGWRPAIALNTTRVETGGRFAFATFLPPSEWGLDTPSTMKGFKERDIRLTTAARLSATFPYVTPISRARPDGDRIPAVHFADGGYYDNTGMGIAMIWLDAALGGKQRTYREAAVAFVRIRSGATVDDTREKERGWLYQTVGPIQTLLAVRTSGQYERADTELEFLQRLWRGSKVNICSFEFAFDKQTGGEPAKPPLSWQLTPNEVRDLDAEWRAPRNREELRRLQTLANDLAGGCPAKGSVTSAER